MEDQVWGSIPNPGHSLEPWATSLNSTHCSSVSYSESIVLVCTFRFRYECEQRGWVLKVGPLNPEDYSRGLKLVQLNSPMQQPEINPVSQIHTCTHTNSWGRLKWPYMQSPGWQPILCLAWCLIWWFASLEKEWSYMTPNVLTETRCHLTTQTQPCFWKGKWQKSLPVKQSTDLGYS